jgi:hypothetical protein
MSLGRITRVPVVESCPNQVAAEHQRRISGRENTISSFASVLNRAERSPLHTDGEGSLLSKLPKEKLLQLLERNQMEMNLRLLKSLGDEGGIPEPAPDPLGMFAAEGIKGTTEGLRETGSREASKSQQHVPKYDASPSYREGASPSYKELAPIIRQASETYGVDQELIRAVIKAESNFQVQSTSPKGARGLMQLMPATAAEMGVTDSYNPVENIMGGTRYLKGLLNRYQGDVPRALAAYNWGPGNVEKYPDRLPRETREYIARVTGEFQSAKV